MIWSTSATSSVRRCGKGERREAIGIGVSDENRYDNPACFLASSSEKRTPKDN
jgi:hypothetical protein